MKGLSPWGEEGVGQHQTQHCTNLSLGHSGASSQPTWDCNVELSTSIAPAGQGQSRNWPSSCPSVPSSGCSEPDRASVTEGASLAVPSWQLVV